jgi:hypothetical protein
MVSMVIPVYPAYWQDLLLKEHVGTNRLRMPNFQTARFKHQNVFQVILEVKLWCEFFVFGFKTQQNNFDHRLWNQPDCLVKFGWFLAKMLMSERLIELIENFTCTSAT